VNLDLADRETDTEPATADPPDPTDDTADRESEPPMADFWSIEGSESGA
jgi:hypothetical protein